MTTIKPRTTTVILFQGDDLDRVAELLEALNSAISSKGIGRVGDGDPVSEAAKAHDEFVTEATPRAESIDMQPLPRKKWREIVTAHPPREGNDTDRFYGFNYETMGDDLVPASIVAPEYAKADDFLDSLSDGQFSKLFSAAVLLNRGGDAPKADLSARVSQVIQTSSETSDSPDRLA